MPKQITEIHPNIKNYPLISANLSGKRVSHFILLIEVWSTLILMYYINKGYYSHIFKGQIWGYLLLPIFIYGLLWQFYILTILISGLIYHLIRIIEPPKEGLFDLSSRESQFYFIRFWMCYYALYVARAMPLPWADMYYYRVFGAHIGKNIVLYDSWIDPEMVDIEDNCMISLNTQLIAHAIIGNQLYVKRVVIKKSGIAGGGAIVAPGTIVREGAVLGGGCTSHFNQELAPYCIHVGSPAKIALPIKIKKESKKNQKRIKKELKKN
ncbi:acyltransferase [Candidatus Harpocratesius sp.]